MAAFIIFIAVLLLLNVAVIAIYIRLVKRLPPMPDSDAEYYDKNGNHIYYDRKLIAQLEREQQKQQQ